MRILAVLFAITLLSPISAHATSSAVSDEELAKMVFEALGKGSRDAFLSLAHPSCPKELLQGKEVDKFYAQPVPANAQAYIEPFENYEILFKIFEFPVTPSVIITLRDTEVVNENTKFFLPIAAVEHRGNWVTLPCPTQVAKVTRKKKVD